MRSFSLRSFRNEDLKPLITLYIACFREPPWHEIFTSEEVRADFELVLSWPETVFKVAIDHEQNVIGAGIGFPVCYKTDVFRLLEDANLCQSFYIAELFVERFRRKQGVCRALASALVEQAFKNRFNALSVRTSVNQPIIRRLFVGEFGCREVATEEVMSRKMVGGEIIEMPDTRIVLARRRT